MFATDPSQALVPLFAEDPIKEGLQPVGSGVFVQFMQQPFLLTAAHVADTSGIGELLAPGFGGIEPIEGYVGQVACLPGQLRDDDRIDVAYYRLSKYSSRSLCTNFKPLPQSKLRLNEKLSPLSACSIYGYPASKTRRLGNRYSSELASYRGLVAPKSDYEQLGLESESSIVVRFSKKRAFDSVTFEKTNPISPRGISGGGIFCWPRGSEFSHDWTLTSLIGIFHSYHTDIGLMVGTPLLYVAGLIQLGQMKNFGGVR